MHLEDGAKWVSAPTRRQAPLHAAATRGDAIALLDGANAGVTGTIVGDVHSLGNILGLGGGGGGQT